MKMREFSRICTLCGLFYISFLPLQLSGQSPAGEQTCDVSFFNATTLEAPLFLDWGGRDAFPDGLPSGRAMGPLMIPAEGVLIEAKADGSFPAKGKVQILPGHKTTLIFYEGPPEKQPGDDDEAKPKLRIFQTQPKEAAPLKEFAWPAVYLGSAPSIQVQVNGQKVQLNQGKTTILASGKKAIDVRQGEKQLAGASVDEPVDYLVVIYGDPKELRGGIVYR